MFRGHKLAGTSLAPITSLSTFETSVPHSLSTPWLSLASYKCGNGQFGMWEGGGAASCTLPGSLQCLRR